MEIFQILKYTLQHNKYTETSYKPIRSIMRSGTISVEYKLNNLYKFIKIINYIAVI